MGFVPHPNLQEIELCDIDELNYWERLISLRLTDFEYANLYLVKS